MENPLRRDLEQVQAHTPSVWPELQNARLFVTGGTGFMGCWMLESFAWACDRLNLNAAMTVLTRSPEAFRKKAPHLAAHPAIRLVEGDVRTFAFPEGRFTHVIHAATDASAQLSRERPVEMFDTIVRGTRRVLEFATTAGVRRFLLLSSGAVCGDWDPADPRAVYANGKREAERLCAEYARQHGIASPIARGFAFVGPYLPLDLHFAIGNFIRDCLEQRPIEIRGDGTPLRSYLYAADMAVWLWTILVRGQSSISYAVGSERAISIAELAATVAHALGASVPVRIATPARTGEPPERYVPETGQARAELGLRESISLEDGIRRTAAWHRALRPLN